MTYFTPSLVELFNKTTWKCQKYEASTQSEYNIIAWHTLGATCKSMPWEAVAIGYITPFSA